MSTLAQHIFLEAQKRWQSQNYTRIEHLTTKLHFKFKTLSNSLILMHLLYITADSSCEHHINVDNGYIS
ncbi:hypothetical protein CDL12_20179 [Handroanthus impetiginosus]|uniref:Uncharacterized protein n=1 Tax=Handroanthus impetiginosus TaxID=429701 RepID=A0A2G9GPP5_9LAMI|nr:hypothetical protein CDL12_20179 [Handroanthus impetiginosus]